MAGFRIPSSAVQRELGKRSGHANAGAHQGPQEAHLSSAIETSRRGAFFAPPFFETELLDQLLVVTIPSHQY